MVPLAREYGSSAAGMRQEDAERLAEIERPRRHEDKTNRIRLIKPSGVRAWHGCMGEHGRAWEQGSIAAWQHAWQLQAEVTILYRHRPFAAAQL